MLKGKEKEEKEKKISFCFLEPKRDEELEDVVTAPSSAAGRYIVYIYVSIGYYMMRGG
jgi:hypothetical protein